MKTQFDFAGFSERENLLAQYIACLALGETESDLFSQTAASLELSDGDKQTLTDQLSQLEQALADADDSLSDLLANASKSTCCS